MTKTDLKTGITHVAATAPEASKPATDSKEIKITSQVINKDSYSSTGKNEFNALLNGAKAATYGGGYDALMGEMMFGFGNTSRPSAADFDEVLVPEARDLLNVPGVERDAGATEAIVERYEGLEELIEGLIGQKDRQIADPETAARMTPVELMSVQEYRQELENKLLFCRRQLEEARFYHAWAEKDVDIATEEVLKETEWWNKD